MEKSILSLIAAVISLFGIWFNENVFILILLTVVFFSVFDIFYI